MNPLGDETGALLVFGVSTLVVLVMAIRLRVGRRPIIRSTLVGLLCGMAIYAIIALASLVGGGLGRYRLDWWLILVIGGMIPAGLIGLVEGLIASVIVRQFNRGTD